MRHRDHRYVSIGNRFATTRPSSLAET